MSLIRLPFQGGSRQPGVGSKQGHLPCSLRSRTPPLHGAPEALPIPWPRSGRVQLSPSLGLSLFALVTIVEVDRG